MKESGNRIVKVAAAVLAVATLVVAIYIMANGLGLSDTLDFGAGAYYYADIPEFEKYDSNLVGNNLSTALAIVLFLLWGALMYWLWTKIDR